jgi:NAD(P)-dependent dehydrogenase (short-subunit alcohol dehydrogenase family)
MKSIFITGAASGIGRATACLFARMGWLVGLFDRDEQGLLSLAAELGEERCCFLKADVTDPLDVQRAMELFAGRTGGKMDLLFNSAGVLEMGLFEEVSLEAQQRVVDVNLKGVINCTHHALPCLKRTPGARIVNMSSASSFYGIPELAVYSATKHALSALTEALDIELDSCGLTVCDIQAPYVKTPMITEAVRKAFSVDRMGINLEADQVAACVWRAAHRRKLHWKMGGPAIHFLLFLFWAFPFAKRAIVRRLALAPSSSRPGANL